MRASRRNFSLEIHALAVERASRAPVILPIITEAEVIETFLDRVDGLVIGGVDVDSLGA